MEVVDIGVVDIGVVDIGVAGLEVEVEGIFIHGGCELDSGGILNRLPCEVMDVMDGAVGSKSLHFSRFSFSSFQGALGLNPLSFPFSFIKD